MPRPSLLRQNLAPYTCLAALGLVVFARCFGSEFIFDSALILQEDPRLAIFSFHNLGLIFTQDYWWPTLPSDLYRPLTTLSFFLEKAVLGFGDRPPPYQLVNLVLHIVAAWLAFDVLRRWQVPAMVAWLSVAWFLIHPYCVEVVPNVVGRSDLLALLSILAAIRVYQRWLDHSGDRKGDVMIWGLILSLGCLAKESAFSGLAICLWHGLTVGQESFRAKWAGVTKRAAVSALIAGGILLVVATILFPKAAFAERASKGQSIAGDNPLVVMSFVESRGNALAILGDNLVNALAPYRVSADYSYAQLPVASLPPQSATDWALGAGAIATLGLGLLCLSAALPRSPTRRLPVFLLGAAFIALLPTANLLVQIGTVRADRLVYPAILFVSSGAFLAAYLLFRKHASHLLPVGAAGITVAGLCVGLFTHLRAVDWRTNRQFWESVFASAPDSYKSRLGYGNVLVKSGNVTDATKGLQLIDSALGMLDQSSWAKKSGATVQAHQLAGGAWMEFARLHRKQANEPAARAAASRAEHLLGRALAMIEAMQAQQETRVANTVVRTSTTVIALAESLRYRGARERALELLDRHAAANRFEADYLAIHGWVLAEAGRQADAEQKLFSALLLDMNNQLLSREIRWFMERRQIPVSQAPLVTDDEREDMKNAPLLSSSSPETLNGLRAAADKLEAALRADGLDTEAAALRRSLRSLTKTPAPSAPSSESNQAP